MSTWIENGTKYEVESDYDATINFVLSNERFSDIALNGDIQVFVIRKMERCECCENWKLLEEERVLARDVDEAFEKYTAFV